MKINISVNIIAFLGYQKLLIIFIMVGYLKISSNKWKEKKNGWTYVAKNANILDDK